MFYLQIQRKRDEWLQSDDCPVRPLLAYIEQRGMMRDAQVEAIKTFLYLKVACQCQPLWQLFDRGTFNSLNLDEVALTPGARHTLESTPAAKALLEYSRLKDKGGRQLAPLLEQYIKDHPQQTDYTQAFRDIFYGADYPDYVFSLPMGAGKTFLMAAFIHLELYFAYTEPDNPAFAHNFMILAPSGLKASIVPSIRHIQDFDPTWVLPEPAASQVHRMIHFEVLDEQKTAQRSNLVKNPNAQKINQLGPIDDLCGLVAVTNAEKVILDKVDKDKGNDPSLYTQEEWQEVKQSNELRQIIGRIPALSIYIDEVHHASDGDIRLRQVVNQWTRSKTFNSVMGFSGTPYLKTAESVTLGNTFTIRNTDLSNVVYHYPLTQGIGNFLKRPRIKTTDNTQENIIREGLGEFLDHFGHTVYPNGTCAKVAIYCSRIENLEEVVYPMVCDIMGSRGYNPAETVLRYHGGNKEYPTPSGSAAEFAALDSEISRIRVVLLAQIGKEGWDCKSLSAVILPQKGACPQNMVLQTACRCLRQVERGNSDERALIWLNDDNAKTLNRELDKQQNTSINEVNNLPPLNKKRIDRYVRRQVPPIDFYQLKISYDTLITEDCTDPRPRLDAEKILGASLMQEAVVHEQDMEGHVVADELILQTDEDEQMPITFHQWLLAVSKEGMGLMPMAQLLAYEPELRHLYDRNTLKEADGMVYLNSQYNQKRVRALVRQAFSPRRDISVRKETVHEKADILVMKNLTSPLFVDDDQRFYPRQEMVHHIVESDHVDRSDTLDEETEQAIRQIKALHLPNEEEMIAQLLKGRQQQTHVHRVKDKTYHYLPYHLDSSFEVKYFAEHLLAALGNKQLEAYFNGDDQLTQFKILCYHQQGNQWHYIGRYVPDFLVLQRNEAGDIHRILIIETKGEGFSAKFVPRKEFMEQEFVRLNNERFGYRRFDFLYIEDTLSPEETDKRTLRRIQEFFETD